METALFLGILGLVGLAVYWVYRAGGAEAREEAYRDNNEALGSRVEDLNRALVEDAQNEGREDRRSAEEIIRNRDAGAARELLRDATRNDSN